MANSNGWGDGAANNTIGWGQGAANNSIGWGDSHAKSWAGATDIVGITTDPAAAAYFTATGITGATQQTAIDNLVKGLKTDGIWTKMKAVYPFVTDNRNLMSYTEDFGNAFWAKTNLSVTDNSTTAPNGTSTADTITANGVSGVHTILASLTLSSATTHSLSVFFKKGTNDFIQIGGGGALFGTEVWANFNLNTGTIGNQGTLTTAQIESFGNGWYRCTVVGATISAGTGTGMFVQLVTSGTSVRGESNSLSTSVFLWGAQLELGSTATTYQPIATTQQAYISSQFKYNLVNPVDSDAAFRLVFNGGWTHSSNGATPNGTNGYADTKLVPSSVLTQDSSHISGYTRTNTSVLAPLLSSENASTYANGIFIWPKYTGGIFSVRVNDDSSDSATAVTNTQGLHLATRTASNVKKYRHNTTQIFSNTTASSALNVASIYIGASRNNANYSTHQTAFNTIGDGLTDTEAANLYTRVQAFQTSLSRNI